MRFLTNAECENWIRGLGIARPDSEPSPRPIRFAFPEKAHVLYTRCLWIAGSLTFRQPCLLWIREHGIWASGENMHLYYRFRQSYGDYRMLHEAPGHLFHEFESEDLASFLNLATLFGWGGYVLPQSRYVRIFFSHDEYFDFHTDDPRLTEEIKQAFQQ